MYLGINKNACKVFKNRYSIKFIMMILSLSSVELIYLSELNDDQKKIMLLQNSDEGYHLDAFLRVCIENYDEVSVSRRTYQQSANSNLQRALSFFRDECQNNQAMSHIQN